MQRRLAVILGFLIVGAIINIAVAWGLALWMPFPTSGQETIHGHRSWPMPVPDEFPSKASRYEDINRRGYRRASFMAFQVTPEQYEELKGNPEAHAEVDLYEVGEQRTFSLELTQSGWPMISMQGGRWGAAAIPLFPMPESALTFSIELEINPNVQVMTFHSGTTVAPPTVSTFITKRLLPFRPVLLGFAINTLLYAALCWLLFTAPFAFRRAMRRQRGLCARCAYPVGSSNVCTECGAALM